MVQNSFLEASALLTSFINDEKNMNTVADIASEMAACFQKNKKVLLAGNGGSACDAMHFAEELTGRFRKDRKALPAISLTDSAHITCVGNDYGFHKIFARSVEAYGQEGDFFIGLSTSGNSQNIIEAVHSAKERNIKTIALLGKNGGKMKGSCDYEIIIPGKTSDRIQEIHMMILHIIIEEVERILFPELY